MLERYVLSEIDNDPDVIFQLDGVPPHLVCIVCESLDRHFPGRWIGILGPISRPPRSPDLTPVDFYFWDYVKDVTCSTKPTSLEELNNRIRNVVHSVTLEMLMQVWQELDYHVEEYLATRGTHIELMSL
jgi:hypothetical protein